jgi:hypothetical protein
VIVVPSARLARGEPVHCAAPERLDGLIHAQRTRREDAYARLLERSNRVTADAEAENGVHTPARERCRGLTLSAFVRPVRDDRQVAALGVDECQKGGAAEVGGDLGLEPLVSFGGNADPHGVSSCEQACAAVW